MEHLSIAPELIKLLEQYLKQIESKYPFDQPPTLEGFAEWLKEQETEK